MRIQELMRIWLSELRGLTGITGAVVVIRHGDRGVRVTGTAMTPQQAIKLLEFSIARNEKPPTEAEGCK